LDFEDFLDNLMAAVSADGAAQVGEGKFIVKVHDLSPAVYLGR
jgi:hypothetical protein